MSNKVALRTGLAVAAKELDTIATEAMAIFEEPGDFAQEIGVAQAVVDMRRLLTDDLMAPVMALMNTDLGFRTDADPNVINTRTGKPNVPYAVEVVREVFIESRLRGFHACGNEFNIIAGRFYGAQNGFKRKVRELTKGTFEPSIDVPIISPDGKSAKVKCRGTWKLGGEKFNIGVRADDPCEFLVRINAFMGADAINGKAERKLLKRVFERITGKGVPDAVEPTEEPGDINVQSTVEKVPDFTAAATSAPVENPAGAASAPDKSADDKSAVPKQATPAGVHVAEQFPLPVTQQPASPQEALANFFGDAGVQFDRFRKWVSDTERLPDAESYSTWAELPTPFVTELAKDVKSLNKAITRCKS